MKAWMCLMVCGVLLLGHARAEETLFEVENYVDISEASDSTAQDSIKASFVPPPKILETVDRVPCDKCGGSGERITEDAGIKDNRRPYGSCGMRLASSEKMHVKVQCLTCKGKGLTVRRTTVEERVQLQQELRLMYDEKCLAKGLVPLAAGYITPDVFDRLSPTEYATLARQYPQRCKRCHGQRVESCRKCKGAGKMVETSYTSCSEEKVRVLVVCKACNGSLAATCRSCKGTGLPDLCKRCLGTGMDTRRKRRKASDEDQGPKLCSSCKGEGRR